MLARIAPDGLVVCVASNARWSRSASIRSVLARTRDAWLKAGSILCALVTIASAPAWRAWRGYPAAKPRWAPHAWSTTTGMPCSWAAHVMAGRSESVPW